ncbi:MAG: glycosyltransferase [Myxococcota bacterium]
MAGETEQTTTHRRVPVAREPRPAWSIVIPCYRSGAWLADLVKEIAANAGDRLPALEIVLVDDASPDTETWPAIERIAREHAFVRGLRLQFNVGQYRALMAGLEASRGDWVVTMDDDFQTHPSALPRFFEAALAHPGMDAIIGRYPEKRHGALRNAGSRLFARLQERIYDRPRDLETTSYRILSRPLVDTLVASRGIDPVFPSIILTSTRRLMNIDIEHHPRAHGDSGYAFSRLVEIVLSQVFDGSAIPLRAVSVLGLAVSAGSLAFGVYSFFSWLTGTIQEPGFTTLVLLLTFLSGTILLSLGVMGEYVMRLVVQLSGTPRYVVRTSTDTRTAFEVDLDEPGDAGSTDGTRP